MNISDCDYKEKLIQKLENASEDLFAADGFPVVNIDLLQENTTLLNTVINRARNNQTESILRERVNPSLKRKFGDRYITQRNLRQDYDNAKISRIEDVVNFIENNQDFFRETFTKRDQIFDGLLEFEELSFVPFSSRYPNIEARIDKGGPITSGEMNAFIVQNGLNEALLRNQISDNRRNIFQLFDDFLSRFGIGTGIMGSFCSLVENVFALSNAKRDLGGNPADFLQNFNSTLSLVNPSTSEVMSNLSDIISLVNGSKQATGLIREKLQEAFSEFGSSFNISLDFSGSGSIDPTWDFEKIRDGIAANDPLFDVILQNTNKPLGDINQDGIVDSDDADKIQDYIDGIASNNTEDYINNIFIPYLDSNASIFAAFLDFPSSSNNTGNLIDDLSNAANRLSSSNSGDFGNSEMNEILSLANSILSSIRGLANSSKPVNIAQIFNQLNRISELGSSAAKNISRDFHEVSEIYEDTTEEALKEAEEVAVSDPTKTAEISETNRENLETRYSLALETVGQTSKDLGPLLAQNVNQVRNGVRQLAAVGVLEQLDGQLSSVIDSSASQLSARLSMMKPSAIDNGFHFNMGSSYQRMAGMIAQAEGAVEEETTEAMKESVSGMIGQSAEVYRQKTKEEMEFVVLRFCKLAGEIERVYRDVTIPIEGMMNNFNGANSILTSSSSDITLQAIRAGAIRYDTATRLSLMHAAGDIPASQTRDRTRGNRSVPAAPGTLPSVMNGPLPILPTEYDSLPRFKDVNGKVWNGLIRYNLGPRTATRLRSAGIGRRFGWDGIFYHGGRNDRGIDMLQRFIALMMEWQRRGKRTPLTINSAYRPGDRTGSGGLSFHALGIALDVSLNTVEREEFSILARRYGFGGIGTYDSFVHIDIGPERSWRG